ncbi:MAG: prepilin-type N-terminal cleavage/methylation domain-containing protein [Armatimonadetes bacterium]|nr:prepilin-type N-terminal cleavage/methylation domain-containing protein [Armatimonadota bacterium]
MNTPCGPWSTKRRTSRAVTLPELLVAMAVFSLVLLIVVAVQSSGLQATRKHDLHEETFRAAMLAAEHLKRELPGALVEGDVGGVPRLTYRVPRLDEQGRPVLGPTGEVLWSGPIGLELDSTGYLIRTEADDVRRLAYLGPEGQVSFLATPDRIDELQVRFVARRKQGEQSSEFPLDLTFRLANQR